MLYRETAKKHHAKVLKTILSLKRPFNDKIVINKSFYLLCKMSQKRIEESLNALAEEQVIELIPPTHNNYPAIKILQKAYAYFPNKAENNFKFWLPTIISIIALFLALLSLIIDVLQLIFEFQKNI